MATSRPVPKSMLKKMFLKVLYEHQKPNGKYQNHGHSYGGIIRSTMPEHYGLTRLDEAETDDALRAVFELERDDFIRQDPKQGPDFKRLSARGLAVVEKSLSDMVLPTIDIDNVLSRDDLKILVHDDYISGDFDASIFKAFRHLEESVRTKCGEPASAIGVILMSTAFNPNNGKLIHPEAQTNSEQDAIHQLMRGAIGWFKNPQSHRTVGYDDQQRAAHALCFANTLLDLVDQCRVR